MPVERNSATEEKVRIGTNAIEAPRNWVVNKSHQPLQHPFRRMVQSYGAEIS